MKTQLLGVCVSLAVHGIVAFLLYNIGQGFSPGPTALALNLSFEAANPIRKSGTPEEGALPAPELSTPGGVARAAEENSSAFEKNTPGPAVAEPPSITPEPKTAKSDPPSEPQALEQDRAEPVPPSLPLAPELPEPKKLKKGPKPLRSVKDPADPPERLASTFQESKEMPPPPEPVSAKTSDDRENTPMVRNGSQGDSLAGPGKNSEKIAPEAMAGQVSQGGKGLSALAGETYPGNTANKGGHLYLNAHLGSIRLRLRQSLCYPSIARQSGWSGKVLIAFTIHTDGLVDQIEIKQSCGIPLLDKSALATVRNACPFPKPPMAVKIIIPILYQLN